LQATELQIWKEVDGIFTADPRKVPTARLLSTISPEEAAELTFFGSEVVHPFTMEQVNYLHDIRILLSDTWFV
jgi:aspartate kinase